MLATVYGAPADSELLAAVEVAQARMRELLEASLHGPRRSDALAQHDREQDWLRTNAAALLG